MRDRKGHQNFFCKNYSQCRCGCGSQTISESAHIWHNQNMPLEKHATQGVNFRLKKELIVGIPWSPPVTSGENIEDINFNHCSTPVFIYAADYLNRNMLTFFTIPTFQNTSKSSCSWNACWRIPNQIQGHDDQAKNRQTPSPILLSILSAQFNC